VITRIRLEAEADTKERVIAELQTAGQRALLAVGGSPWELTDDVVVPNRDALRNIQGYKGRNVYHYRGSRKNT
jgi:hypothetical protein